MAKNLVIVESPAKAKTIKRYLGSDFQVIPSVGHVMDLPKSTLGVAVDDDFKPEYHVIAGKAKVLKEIQTQAKKARSYLSRDRPGPRGRGHRVAHRRPARKGQGHRSARAAP